MVTVAQFFSDVQCMYVNWEVWKFVYRNYVHCETFLTHAVYVCIGYNCFTLLSQKFVEFCEIAQYNGHCAIHGHPRLLTVMPVECVYDLLLLIINKLHHIYYYFLNIVDDCWNFRLRHGLLPSCPIAANPRVFHMVLTVWQTIISFCRNPSIW